MRILRILLCICVFKLAAADPLLAQYEIHCRLISDINEHIPRLRELASECSSVVEIGTRGLVSTWGFLQGLAESKSKDRSYIGIDLNAPPKDKLSFVSRLAKEKGISFRFWEANDFLIDIAPVDLLFIDSWHTYRHLTYELEKFSPKVQKYIAMHDTSEPWGHQDEGLYCGFVPDYPAHINREKKGLWPAVVDFLKTHPEWTLKERRLNNHGLTVLERKQ